MEEGHEEDIGSSGDGCGRWRGRGDGSGARRGARHRPGPGVWSGGRRVDRGRDRGVASLLLRAVRLHLLRSGRLLCAWPLCLLWRAVSVLSPPLLSSLVTHVTLVRRSPERRAPGFSFLPFTTRTAAAHWHRHCARW